MWVLKINADTPDKSIKTRAAKRIIPLHPFLTNKLKFVDYVNYLKQKGEERVFPELKKMGGKYGHAPSKWFSSYRDKLKIKPDDPKKRKVFHSFRPTFINHLKQKSVNKMKLKEVIGHAKDDITHDVYSNPYAADDLFKSIIKKVKYEVDLSHLAKFEFVKDFDFAYSKIERNRFKEKYNL